MIVGRMWVLGAGLAMFATAAALGCNHFDGTDTFRQCPECFGDGAADIASNDGAPNDGASDGGGDGPSIVVADASLPECPPDSPDLDEDKHVPNYTGLACGDDCDDDDPRARPDQTDWFAFATDIAGFDWNCNGVLDVHFPSLAVCTNASGSGDPCQFSEGWLGPTVAACGVTAQWVSACAELSGPGTCGVPPGGLVARVQECH